jgi:hypothetical protein
MAAFYLSRKLPQGIKLLRGSLAESKQKLFVGGLWLHFPKAHSLTSSCGNGDFLKEKILQFSILAIQRKKNRLFWNTSMSLRKSILKAKLQWRRIGPTPGRQSNLTGKICLILWTGFSIMAQRLEQRTGSTMAGENSPAHFSLSGAHMYSKKAKACA